MKKVVKKATTKKVAKKKETFVRDVPVLVENQCPDCGGIGLSRPDWVNSPKCETCQGNGTI